MALAPYLKCRVEHDGLVGYRISKISSKLYMAMPHGIRLTGLAAALIIPCFDLEVEALFAGKKLFELKEIAHAA